VLVLSGALALAGALLARRAFAASASSRAP
jgi:hypothetical protein